MKDLKNVSTIRLFSVLNKKFRFIFIQDWAFKPQKQLIAIV